MTLPEKRLPITAIIPVKNEERNLPECLRSLAGLERVIVVDSGSTDTTRQIAEHAGAVVLDFHWDGGPIKKRNWVLRNHAPESEWILFIDADERLTDDLKTELARVLPNTDKNGFWLRYTNYFMGRRLRFGEPMIKLTIVRRQQGEFEVVPERNWSTLDMEVHEHLIVNGQVGTLRANVIHHDDKGVGAWFRRHLEYASWEAERYFARADAQRTLRQRIKYRLAGSLLFPVLYFVYAYFLRLGFLDGIAGLRFASAKCSYFTQVALRIAERRGEIT